MQKRIGGAGALYIAGGALIAAAVWAGCCDAYWRTVCCLASGVAAVHIGYMLAEDERDRRNEAKNETTQINNREQ